MTTTRARRPSQPLLCFPIEPCPAPRMTRADGQRGRAGARPCVRRYWEFQDALRALAATERYYPGDTLSLRFVLPMPTSWSGKKRRETAGQPHTVKPDLDNLIKAVKDSLLVSDSHVWRYERMEKVWGVTGSIEVLPTAETEDRTP